MKVNKEKEITYTIELSSQEMITLHRLVRAGASHTHVSERRQDFFEDLNNIDDE